MRDYRSKVGRYPLQKTSSETCPGSYESTDYLYAHSAGFVWLRVVHDLDTSERLLSMEFISQGVRFRRWLPPLLVAYGERMLCRAARRFANEKSAPPAAGPLPTETEAGAS